MLFKRAAGLDNGISVSWLDQTWKKGILDTTELNKADFELLKKLGFKTIRLPVAFSYFETQHVPLEKVLARVDEVMKKCDLYGFKLIIDNHYGNLNDQNYLTVTQEVIDLWLTLAKRYKHVSPDRLFLNCTMSRHT